MPRFRADVSSLTPYKPGRPIIEVAAEHGFEPDEVVKLASNESPLPPLQVALDAMGARLSEVNRYPDNESRLLKRALADRLGLPFEWVWVGAGSSELLRTLATALGGPGTSAVYAWPSFVVYRLATVIAGARPIEVPLEESSRHDLDAMLVAIEPDTTIVYVCNPNNPTGTLVSPEAIGRFVAAVPAEVVVVVDEAYFEYVTAEGHRSALELVDRHPNLVVTRTFSKIYGLASLRVGYGVARPEVVTELRKAQAPFSVTDLGQVAALASLEGGPEIAERSRLNEAGRDQIESALAELGIQFVPSQANFVFFRLGAGTAEVTEAFVRHGVILRPFSRGWVRVSVGTAGENTQFLSALTTELPNLT